MPPKQQDQKTITLAPIDMMIIFWHTQTMLILVRSEDRKNRPDTLVQHFPLSNDTMETTEETKRVSGETRKLTRIISR